jgi:hypothetical protein
MIQYFKSLWMRMRKTNSLPGNEVLIPINDKIVVEVSVKQDSNIPPAPKISRPKRKYVRKATSH